MFPKGLRSVAPFERPAWAHLTEVCPHDGDDRLDEPCRRRRDPRRGGGQMADRISSTARHMGGTAGSPTIRTVPTVTLRPAARPSGGGRGPEVEILRWPEDGERREDARRVGRPRLLLLEPGTAPPPPEALEDWAWSPIDERDLASRLRRLSVSSPIPPVPDVTVDADGVLRTAGRIVPLPPIEAALMRSLSESPGSVRRREELARAAWGGEVRVRRSLDSRVLSLRRRIAPVGLGIVTVRGEGFVLVPSRDVEPGT